MPRFALCPTPPHGGVALGPNLHGTWAGWVVLRAWIASAPPPPCVDGGRCASRGRREEEGAEAALTLAAGMMARCHPLAAACLPPVAGEVRRAAGGAGQGLAGHQRAATMPPHVRWVLGGRWEGGERAAKATQLHAMPPRLAEDGKSVDKGGQQRTRRHHLNPNDQHKAGVGLVGSWSAAGSAVRASPQARSARPCGRVGATEPSEPTYTDSRPNPPHVAGDAGGGANAINEPAPAALRLPRGCLLVE